MPGNSTPRRKSRKSGDRPSKPYAAFPLTPHASGAWQKKIRGKVCYFGKWGKRVNGKLVRIEGDGWQTALEIYKAQADDLHAGRTPRVAKAGELTIGDLRDRFLTAKSRSLDAGEITARTYGEYKQTMLLLVAKFGEKRVVDDLAADDFEQLRSDMADRWGPVRLGNEITKVKTIFKYGYEAGLIDKPIRYGPSFRKPSAKVMRLNRASNGKKMLTTTECRKLIDAAPIPLKAMLLLGLNAGFGNHDCATLPLESLDLDGDWIDYPRPKTGIDRRVPLWPETTAALRDALAERPHPKTDDAEGLVFLLPSGRPWLCRGIANPVSVATRELMQAVGIHRPGLGHYTLRHIHRTVADHARDQPAAAAIMGHADASMRAVYVEQIEDSRLRSVVEHVRRWLFAEEGGAE